MSYEAERKKREIEEAHHKMLAAWAAYEVAQATVSAAHNIYREKREILVALKWAELEAKS